MTTPDRREYVGKHRSTEFPDSSPKGRLLEVFCIYVGKHRTDAASS